MISQIDIDAMQNPEPPEGTDAAVVLDAAHRFAKSVCQMFEGDAHWAVTDLDGAGEFFDAIGYQASAEALTVTALDLEVI